MKTKRILGFVALPLVAIAGLLIPKGLSGQTDDAAGVASLSSGGTPAQPVAMPAPPQTGFGMGSYAMPPQGPNGFPQMMVAEPSFSAYGGGFTQYVDQAQPTIDFQMTDPTSGVLFGPQINFDVNMGEGLGWTEGFYRMSALVPWHVNPGRTVLMGDVAASVNDDGRGTFSGGLIYRNFDVNRNRIFGWNTYYDNDQAVQAADGYQRLTFGVESLGQFFDFRANGYYILGEDTNVLSSRLTGDCSFEGHNILATRERMIETAFSGVDAEMGGPLPFLGHYGINGYVGGYWLTNDTAGDTVGVSGRVQAYINDMTTANVTYTNDNLLGDTAWAQLSVTLPRWRARGFFKPRTMQERMGDPVYRSNRVHVDVATFRNTEAIINPLDGQPYELLYVDPNATTNGTGSAESPFSSLEALAASNRPNYDILSIAPRGDNSSTNLTTAAGLDLFAGQQLLGRTRTQTIFDDGNFVCDLPSLIDDPTFLPSITNPADRALIQAPLLSNSTGGAGSYVVRLADNNRVSGLRFDGNGGRGIIGNRIRDFEITGNEFFGHTTAIDLNNVRGTGNVSENTINGEDSTGARSSANGLVISAAAGESLNLLADDNTVIGHTGTGVDIVARPGARITANDPNGVSGIRSGILNNNASGNGGGIRMEARTDAVINASIEDNTFSDNTDDGFLAISDDGLVVLRSFARNTGNNNGGNGAFFLYRNGGRFFAQSEDANGNGIFDLGEDVNGNGVFDLGFVQNELSGNGENGLCIFGQGSGLGRFDIGGSDESLGNTFLGNADAGIAYDLTGTARGQFDILNNAIRAGGPSASLTLVMDFLDPGQASITDFTGAVVTPFDPTNFGFTSGDFNLVTNSVLQAVRDRYLNIPTSDVDPNSPIPPGMALDIEFVIGETGVRPAGVNGEFYTALIGDTTNPLVPGLLGISNGIGQLRDQTGVGPNGPGALPGVTPFGGNPGEIAVTAYPNLIATIGGLTPPDAFVPGLTVPRGEIPPYLMEAPSGQVSGLTAGNLDFTTNALTNVIAHEVGHAVSLRHVLAAGAVTPTGEAPLMGTGAFDLTAQNFIEPLEFSYSGNNPGELPGEAPFVQNSIQQLVDALGLRNASTVSGPGLDGIRGRASDDARVEPTRILNNTIEGMTRDGVSITARGNAVQLGVDIQGSTISNNGGQGVKLEARGANARIIADQSIGGSGMNSLGGNLYPQSNTISNNAGDGLTFLAANGGMINGNVINNEIANNGGNGISFLIEEFGTLDFGDVTGTNNRLVDGNNISGSGGFGMMVQTESVPGEVTTMKLLTQNNTISNNTSGGLYAELTGVNNVPPALASPVINSTFDLTMQGETLDGNGDVGVAVHLFGNTKADVLIDSSTISSTGPGTVFGGDGINFERQGQSLLTALVTNNTISNSAGDGMQTLYSGDNLFAVNQPMSGTINTVEWNNNTITGSGGNGVAFIGRADGMLLGDGANNIISNNASNGILVDTREFSTFGNPADLTVLPPGRRVLFQSNQITDNGLDGVGLLASDNSRQLVQITSGSSSTTTNPHQAGLTDGDTVIANNGRYGIYVNAVDNSDIDLLVNSGTGQTAILNNGQNGGGSGIMFEASGTTDSTVTVQETLIAGSVAGATEDANGNGVIDFGEDTNQNGFLDTEDVNGNGQLDLGEDTNNNGVLDTEDTNGNGALDGSEDASNAGGFFAGNRDIDVVNGDGIRLVADGNATPTLVVGGVGLGNTIQLNQDDGISIEVRGGISAAGSGSTGQARPVINIQENLIGGFADGLPAGNLGDGLGFNVSGGAFAAPQLDGSVNPAGDRPGFFQTDTFRNEIGPIVTATINNNDFSQSGRRGSNFRMTGASGTRIREGLGLAGFAEDLNIIQYNDNVSRGNAEDGVIFQANARFLENRAVNLFTNGPPGAGNGLQPPYSPNSPELIGGIAPPIPGLNFNSLNGQSSYMADYLSLRTAQNTDLQFLRNEVSGNGTSLISGRGTGLTILVSANTYLSADVQTTRFGGNLDADLFVDGLSTAGNPINSIDYLNSDATNPDPFDTIFLDDTAQLDLRFDDNSGNQIEVNTSGVNYTNFDFGKAFGAAPTTARPGALFQIDGGPFLNAPNNVFNFQGSIQNIRAAFSTAGFFERAISDPAFPNINFPPPLAP